MAFLGQIFCVLVVGFLLVLAIYEAYKARSKSKQDQTEFIKAQTALQLMVMEREFNYTKEIKTLEHDLTIEELKFRNKIHDHNTFGVDIDE